MSLRTESNREKDGNVACHHKVFWNGEWPPPDETYMTCSVCECALVYANDYLSPVDEELWKLDGFHWDRVAHNPLSTEPTMLLGRYTSHTHPDLGGQERNGSATYVYISDPHPMRDCPFGDGPLDKSLDPNTCEACGNFEVLIDVAGYRVCVVCKHEFETWLQAKREEA